MEISSSTKKIAIVTVLMLICIAMTVYFQSKNIDTVYTHLFYIPIILACIWWQNIGVIMAIILGISIIVTHASLSSAPTIINDLLRAGIFLLISILVSKLSSDEKDKKFLLEKKNEELKSSYLGLQLKNMEIQRYSKLEIGKDRLIKDLEKKLKTLSNKGKAPTDSYSDT